MAETNKYAPFVLSGRWRYRLQSLVRLYGSMFTVSIRRLLRGPRFPNWSWALEFSIHFMKAHASAAFDLPNISDGREYEDAFVFGSAAMTQVDIESVTKPIKGHWYQPKSTAGRVTILYLHGGGYAYYSKAHQNLIALVTLAADAHTFALDYRLIPEHPFPAQLEDALAAYRWLLETGIPAERLVVMGDSAGGNLTISLMLALREAALPLPALTVGLCPWMDLSNPGDSMTTNEGFDWIERRMPIRWAEWFCKGTNAVNPLVSPIHADLKGLPPMYLQAGSAEILLDMIRAFADRAAEQGANVRLDVWPNMPHDFQAFGSMVSESKESLQRMAEVIREYIN